ncbi:hypothetical protein RDI58_013538 [Solanum bulbocastanum]|uniref:Uncharacterized protein n=1 Tax=Solanum bulbocastanum TaxID=147425 RepID=A0AAN8TJR0_SOLBU
MRYTIELKLTIMNVMERIRVISPWMRLLGKVCKISSSALRDVKTDKNTNREVLEVTNESAFGIAKMMKAMFPEKMGSPLCLWLPPCTMFVVVNVMVATSVAAIVMSLKYLLSTSLHLLSTFLRYHIYLVTIYRQKHMLYFLIYIYTM